MRRSTLPPNLTLIPRTDTAKRQASSPILFTPSGEQKQEIFDKHFGKCYLKVGDKVCFKKPRRNKIRGTIDHIETDVRKIYWSEGGETPRYIRVRIEKIDKETGIAYGHEHVWTTQNKLLFGV